MFSSSGMPFANANFLTKIYDNIVIMIVGSNHVSYFIEKHILHIFTSFLKLKGTYHCHGIYFVSVQYKSMGKFVRYQDRQSSKENTRS